MGQRPPHAEAFPAIKITCQTAWDVRCVIQRLYEGYFSYQAVRHAAESIYSGLPPTDDFPFDPSLPPSYRHPHIEVEVFRADGLAHRFHRNYYLREAYEQPDTVAEMERAWFVGALMSATDALLHYRYFDRSPTLELLYHLRNGVGHGNVFDFDSRALERLRRYPAHNREAWPRSTQIFEIVPSLRGTPVLFDFMKPGDVLDTLEAASCHLGDIAQGRKSPAARAPQVIA